MKEEWTFSDTNNKNEKGPIRKTHIFPLLKIVQLYDLMKIDINPPILSTIREKLKNSLHYHLSLASIANSNFDAAELVFSLEALLLLDSNKDNFDKNLLDRVFEVVKERQEISLYWRPLKPFVSNQQGLALLPLSVEIAMSLIRICRLLEKKGEKLFSKNFVIFNKYTEWIKTRVSVVSCEKTKIYTFEKGLKPNEFYGWCSEHIHEQDVIHPWETSQVLVYLANFNDMLQKNIAYKSLKYANLTVEPHNKNEADSQIWVDWVKTEPVDIEKYQVYKHITKEYITELKSFSMLLYGPPGTGKTTLAKKIAETKGWSLITITPSDFIANGADQVETKAKNIFTTLQEQQDMVVLFDEIDRLILDRDSGFYSEQSDIFQFMTPSMLVKLNDLRKRAKIIFIINTNYEERIDKAIKRIGRVDNKYLVLPPNKERRKSIIEKFLKKKGISLKDDVITEISKNTTLYTFGELEQLSKAIIEKMDIRNACEIQFSHIAEYIIDPSLTLTSYIDKIGLERDRNNKEKNPQKPVREFLSLVYLKAEANKEKDIFSEKEISLVEKFLEKNGNTKVLNDELNKDMVIKVAIALLREKGKKHLEYEGNLYKLLRELLQENGCEI